MLIGQYKVVAEWVINSFKTRSCLVRILRRYDPGKFSFKGTRNFVEKENMKLLLKIIFESTPKIGENVTNFLNCSPFGTSN